LKSSDFHPWLNMLVKTFVKTAYCEQLQYLSSGSGCIATELSEVEDGFIRKDGLDSTMNSASFADVAGGRGRTGTRRARSVAVSRFEPKHSELFWLLNVRRRASHILCSERGMNSTIGLRVLKQAVSTFEWKGISRGIHRSRKRAIKFFGNTFPSGSRIRTRLISGLATEVPSTLSLEGSRNKTITARIPRHTNRDAHQVAISTGDFFFYLLESFQMASKNSR
jgi:hypothetical protein